MDTKTRNRPKRQKNDNKRAETPVRHEDNILEFVQNNDHIFDDNNENLNTEIYDFDYAKEQKEKELKKRRAHRQRVKEEQKKLRDAHTKKHAIFMIAGIIAVLLAFTVYSASVKLMANNVSQVTQTASFEIEASEKSVAASYNGGIIVSDRGKIILYDDHAREVLSQDSVSGMPIIKTAGNSAAVAYMSTKNAYIVNDGKIITITAPEIIKGISVSQNGVCAVVCEEEGYRGQVVVYDADGNDIYRWHSANDYITDVSVSPDGKNMVVATLEITDEKASAEAVFFDFRQNEAYATFTFEDNVCSNVKHLSKSRIAMVCDDKTYILSKSGKLAGEVDYKGMKPTTFDTDSDGNMVICFKHDDSILSQCDVVVFNRNGKEKGRYTANSAVSAVSINKSKVLAVPERRIVLVSESGKEIYNGEINKDVKQAFLLDDLTSAVVISGTTAQYIELK